MSNKNCEPMMEIFIFETTQLLEQLEQSILKGEKSKDLECSDIHEIFRIMHTIKGSAAMMSFESIASVAHSVEDLFYYLREYRPSNVEYSELTDLVLESSDFIKTELEKIIDDREPDGNSECLTLKIKDMLHVMKNLNSSELNKKLNCFQATIFFEEDCGMENIRAFTLIHSLEELAKEINCNPSDTLEDEEYNERIRQEGLKLTFTSEESYEKIHEFLLDTAFLKDLFFEQISKKEETVLLPNESPSVSTSTNESVSRNKSVHQSLISVNVKKLDLLMDLVGEMVISEAMVLQNPDLKGLKLDNFNKAARQLQKITNELRDIVMEIRMVPLSPTFKKMERIVRDMSKKLEKDVQLLLVGEDTEVDKNIIENISDPLIHLVRNSIDHGIETLDERIKAGKPKIGTITLEAKNVGNDVLIIVKDDGLGLDKNKILKKAETNGLLHKPVKEMTDKEIYNLIFLPGFSTEETISEFSGRGVGMDVVTKNIGNIGGSVSVDSVEGIGSTITLKIPLTLAIIDGMTIGVGDSRYTVPIATIKQSFRPNKTDIIKDPNNNEMIMVRGQCYPILSLHEYFGVQTEITDFVQGIFIMVEQGGKTMCLFADTLLGQQQVVVKSLPNYIKNTKNIIGLSGCTLLGDGSISLILDIGNLMDSDNNNYTEKLTG